MHSGFIGPASLKASILFDRQRGLSFVTACCLYLYDRLCVCQGAVASSSGMEDTLRQELNSQREVSARLRQDLAAARQHLHDMTAQWEEQHSSLQEQLQQQEAQVQRLQLELQQRPTAARVAELQQQVRVLQAVGYGSLPEEELGAAGVSVSASGQPGALEGALSLGSEPSTRSSEAGLAAGAQGGLNLEGLLLAKNRKLEHEVTVARLALAEANQQLEGAREQVGRQMFPGQTAQWACRPRGMVVDFVMFLCFCGDLPSAL